MRLAEILQELRSQSKQPIWVKYRIHERRSSQFNMLLETAGKATDTKNATGALPDTVWDSEREWAIKGGLGRISLGGPRVVGGHLVPSITAPIVHVYDGNKTIMCSGETVLVDADEKVSQPVYKLTRERGPDFEQSPPLDVTGQNYLLLTLGLWDAKKDAFNIAVRDESHDDGKPIVYVELGSKNSARMTKAWLLGNCGYVVKRLEHYHDNGKLASEFSNLAYQEVEGIYYPKSAVCRHYSDKGSFLSARELEVVSLVTRAAEIPDSLFTLELPPDAAIYDLDRQTMVRDPARVQSCIDEVIAPRFFGKPWFRILLCILGIAILSTIYVFRRYGRRRNGVVR